MRNYKSERSTAAVNIQNIVFPVLFGAVVLGILTYYKFHYGIRLMESDSASDLVYANLLAKEGTFLSDNWYFSTEIRIFDNELLFALLFKLFPGLGWWEIETIGTALMNLFLGLSSVLLAYQLGMGKKSLWMFGFSLLPYGFSEFYYVLMHGCGYYVLANIEVFVMLSLYLAIVNRNSRKKTAWYIIFGIFLILSFLIGLQGVRLLESLYAPLLAGVVVLFLYRYTKDGGGLFWSYVKKQGRYVLTAAGGCCTACMGFAINKVWLSNYFIWENAKGFQWKEFSVKPIETIAAEVMSNLGYLPNAELFSGRGIFNCISILLCATIIVLLTGATKKKAVFQWNHLIICYFLAAFLIHTFIYIFLFEEYKPRYMLPFFMVLPHVLYQLIQRQKAGAGKRLTAVLTVCSVLVSGNIFFYGHARGNHQKIDTEKQQEMAEFLVENHYRYGFSTFWYGNSTIQLSDGELDIVSLGSLEHFGKYEWLSTKEEINYGWPEKTFLIVSDSQLAEYPEAAWNQEQKAVWHDGGICVFAYETVEELQSLFLNE